MKVENFSDEKVREMAENVRLNKITIPQSSFDAMKARCALFDEVVSVLEEIVEADKVAIAELEAMQIDVDRGISDLTKKASSVLVKVKKL